MSKSALKMMEPDDAKYFDTHRLTPKRDGGEYTKDNYIVTDPRDHMKRHNTLRLREESLAHLKSVVDDRRQVMKLVMKINNQILAFKRQTDEDNPEILKWLEGESARIASELKARDRIVVKAVKAHAKLDPLAKSALDVKSVGPITVAHCLCYIDMNKARHASSLWAYVGLDKPNHARYEKNVAGGGNKTLRTCLYNLATSQIKNGGPYRVVYDQVKARLEKSDRIVKTRNTQGKLVEKPWKETKPSHRHGAALRAVIKHFLADYWRVGRELAGLPTDPLYAEAVLKGTHRTIQPRERGWKW